MGLVCSLCNTPLYACNRVHVARICIVWLGWLSCHLATGHYGDVAQPSHTVFSGVRPTRVLCMGRSTAFCKETPEVRHTAQVWDTRKFKVPLHVWEGLPANFETTKVFWYSAPVPTVIA